ncbi:protein FLC EXPRESSOR-like [Typha angustifolia]|uniref:protein FLC EXPRESSOR-like n=1 Tax=Typha angustifolia TaxID=59011 RepID=UPI003C302AD7
MSSRRAPHVLHLRDQHPPLLGRAPPPPPAVILLPPPAHRDAAAASVVAALEDRLAAQHRDVDVLLLDNQRLAATHVALKQEVVASQHELRRAAAAAAKLRAEKDAEIRRIFERSIKAEAEAKGVEEIRAELARVRSEVQRMRKDREDLAVRLEGIKGEVVRARADIGQVSAVRAEIEAMHREIQKGRAAVEFEKKTHSDNLVQSQIMQSNMISMAHEIEKVRAGLANVENRVRATAATAAAAAAINPGYTGTHGNSEMTYGGTSYGDAYNMHQVQIGADVNSQYVPASSSRGPYDTQQTHAHR